MPWIDTEVKHERLMDDLWSKILKPHTDKNGNPWWQPINDQVEKVDLYKLTFTKKSLVNIEGEWRRPSFILSSSTEGTFCATRHSIMRRWDGQYLGIAQTTGAIKYKLQELPEDEDVTQWFLDMYEEHVDYTSMHVYTLDEYRGYTHTEDGGVIKPFVFIGQDEGKGVLRASLDVEYFTDEMYYSDSFQSPIITMNMIQPEGTFTDNILGSLRYRSDTNWWKDSLIRVKGYIDPNSLFLTFQLDSAPSWDDNIVPIVPLFFGNLKTVDGKDDVVAVFGGTHAPYDYDFDDSSVGEEAVLQPITRNYINYPSNGVDTIMVKKSKYGARYQKNYLRWNAPPNAIPPEREVRRGKDRKYPRAWNQQRGDYYKYQFNPSRYSEKTHVSRAYVVHPEDGVVGYIPNIILTPIIGMTEGEILELTRYCEDCPEGGGSV